MASLKQQHDLRLSLRCAHRRSEAKVGVASADDAPHGGGALMTMTSHFHWFASCRQRLKLHPQMTLRTAAAPSSNLKVYFYWFLAVQAKVEVAVADDAPHGGGALMERPPDDPFFLNRMPLAERRRYISAYAEQVSAAA